MRRYEYKVVDTSKDVEQRLNDLGTQAGRWSG
jgi:hypothetical protein